MGSRNNSKARGERASDLRDQLVNTVLLSIGGSITGYAFFIFLSR